MRGLDEIIKMNDEVAEKELTKRAKIIKGWIAQSPMTRPSYRHDDLRR
jgi:hypothetical protein